MMTYARTLELELKREKRLLARSIALHLRLLGRIVGDDRGPIPSGAVLSAARDLLARLTDRHCRVWEALMIEYSHEYGRECGDEAARLEAEMDALEMSHERSQFEREHSAAFAASHDWS